MPPGCVDDQDYAVELCAPVDQRPHEVPMAGPVHEGVSGRAVVRQPERLSQGGLAMTVLADQTDGTGRPYFGGGVRPLEPARAFGTHTPAPDARDGDDPSPFRKGDEGVRMRGVIAGRRG